MIVQDLLRPFSCFPVRRELSSGPHGSIRFPAKSQPIPFHRSIADPLTARSFLIAKKAWNTVLLYRLRTLRLFGSFLSIPSFLCTSFRSDVKKYINIAMHYGIALKILRGQRHTSDWLKNIRSLKSPLHFQTSTTARFGKWATTHVGTIFRLIQSVFREEVIIDFCLARLASDC